VGEFGTIPKNTMMVERPRHRRSSEQCRAQFEQDLERGHRQAPPVVAEYEFIQVELELIAAAAVVRADQPVIAET
jgi:hypothetical protein